jgi:hypothetical protein
LGRDAGWPEYWEPNCALLGLPGIISGEEPSMAKACVSRSAADFPAVAPTETRAPVTPDASLLFFRGLAPRGWEEPPLYLSSLYLTSLISRKRTARLFRATSREALLRVPRITHRDYGCHFQSGSRLRLSTASFRNTPSNRCSRSSSTLTVRQLKRHLPFLGSA